MSADVDIGVRTTLQYNMYNVSKTRAAEKRAGLARLVTGKLPGGPVSVRSMLATLIVVFKCTINCQV